MFSNTARPSSMAATMLAKLSSSRIRSAASLATSVPEMPMAMPMSAHFSAGASLTPSPVTATISPFFCNAWTISIFCSAATRAKMISLRVERQLQLRRRDGAQLVAADDHGLVGLHQPDLAGNRQRRVRMVAGDHDDADAGCVAQRAMASGTSGRGGSSSPTSPVRIMPRSSPGMPSTDCAMGEGQHPQSGLGHLPLRRQQARFHRRIDRHDARIQLHEVAGGEHGLRRTFAVEHATLGAGAQHRHALAVGIERNLVNALIVGELADDLPPHVLQRHFHRVAQHACADRSRR